MSGSDRHVAFYFLLNVDLLRSGDFPFVFAVGSGDLLTHSHDLVGMFGA